MEIASALLTVARRQGAGIIYQRFAGPLICRQLRCVWSEPERIAVLYPRPLQRPSLVPIHQFHAGKVVSAPRRRRRQGGGGAPVSDADDDAAEIDGDRLREARPSAVKDLAVFTAATVDLLSKIEAALKPMESCNDGFFVKRVTDNAPGEYGLDILLSPGEGEYSLRVDGENRTVALKSPMSGMYTYVLCDKTGDFRGMDDGHILEGLLTRDLIRHCNGVPKF
mmetsp:Transcript_3805/g.8108  ORF Transcript_3805/g.8108 Transcript_3805/m.8108 type:complete len:223 (+) Transcript_3805:72-740(+)